MWIIFFLDDDSLWSNAITAYLGTVEYKAEKVPQVKIPVVKIDKTSEKKVADVGALKFACPYCQFRNKRKDHIYRHIRSKHPNQTVCYIDLSLQ